MKLRTFKRHAKEGFRNLGRNGWVTFASVSAVTVALALVGVFVALMLNLNAIATQLENDVEVRVYIDRTAEQAEQEQLKTEINSLTNVTSIEFQSKAEGLNQFIDSLGDQGDVFSALRDENPLPDAFIVKTKSPEDVSSVAQSIENMKNVGDVKYGQVQVERLFSVIDTSRNIGIALIIGLLFTAIFLIGNTIKLTIVARQKEIEIMKLVGATNGFIRWPFLMEGLLLGVIGALIPVGLLVFGYQFVYEYVVSRYQLLTDMVDLVPVNPMIYYLAGALLITGALIGTWGSLTSVRKFLKV